MGVDILARGVAASSRRVAQAAGRLPATIGARRPLAADHAGLAVLSAPPTITRSSGGSTTIGSAVQFSATSGVFRFTGTPLIAHAVLGGGWRVQSRPDGQAAGANWIVVEWYSDANLVELRLSNSNGAFDIKVDGQPVQSDVFSTSAAGSAEFVKLDWAADPWPRKPRLYRLEGYNLPFGGVYVEAAGSCWYPSDLDSRELMVWLGDSYTQSTGGTVGRRHVAPLTSALLGFDHWHDGVGSTGWNSTGGNLPVTRNERYIGYLTRAPQFIVTALGYNDSAGHTAVAENYDLWIAAAKASWPKARIITLGPWTPAGSTSNLSAVRAALQDRAAANGAQFVDIANIVNAANKTAYTGGDNVHPNANGHVYLARRIAQAMQPVLGLE